MLENRYIIKMIFDIFYKIYNIVKGDRFVVVRYYIRVRKGFVSR